MGGGEQRGTCRGGGVPAAPLARCASDGSPRCVRDSAHDNAWGIASKDVGWDSALRVRGDHDDQASTSTCLWNWVR